MTLFRKIVSVLLLVICVGTLTVPAAAASTAYAEHEGLQVTVVMDKEYYEEGEPITATITVLNTNSQPVTIVNLEQLIPEGYVLAENSEVATRNVEIKPKQTIELQVTFVGQPAQQGESGEGDSFWDKLFYGETWGIPNILLAAVIVIIIIIFMLLT